MTTDRVDENPYIGLRSFDAGDGRRFHGRSTETREVAALWHANRLTILYGPSGIGKTSLLQAGVIATLDQNRSKVLPVGRVSYGSAFPLAAVPEHNPYTFALLSSWANGESPARLSGLTLKGFFGRREEAVDPYGDPIPTLIAIDQAEELFDCPAHRASDRDAAVEDLASALDDQPGLRLLVLIREDHLSSVLPYEGRLGHRSRARVQLQPFLPRAAQDAVRRPLEDTARSFAPLAAEELVDELRTVRLSDADGRSTTVSVGTVEPVQLQVVCAELWHALPDDVQIITGEHVRRYGDVAGSIAGFCARALREVAAEHDRSVPELRTWLKQTFITELGTRSTTYEGLSETAGMPNAVLRALEDRRLLRAEHRAGSRWYELQHDRLIEPIRLGDDEDAPLTADLSAHADTPARYLHTAQLALSEGQFALAKRNAELALSAYGEHDLQAQAEVRSFLGNVAHGRGELEEALFHYREAATLFEVQRNTPAVGLLLKASGRLLLRLGRPQKARADLLGAQARLPEDPGVRVGIAWAQWHLGQRRAALQEIDAVLNADRSNIDARRTRGEMLAEEGQARLALIDLEGVRPLPPPAHAALALAHARLGEFEDAVREANSAISDAPENGLVLWRAARVHELSGDLPTALSLTRRATEATATRLLPHEVSEVGRWLQEKQADGRN